MKRIRRMIKALRDRRDDRDEQSGAVLVETSIVVVLLFALAFGMSDYAYVLRQSLSSGSVSRAAARAGSGLGNERFADYEMIQAARAAATDLPGDAAVTRIIVYRSTTADGAVPSACTAPLVGSIANVCNVYRPADFTVARTAVLPNGCIPGHIGWCPTSRQTNQYTGTDFIGVWVEISLDPLAGVTPGLPTRHTVHTVMRVEPRVG